MRRYDDASRLRWRNVEFEPSHSSFHLSFEKKKNDQCMQGSRVTVVAATTGPVCPLKLLEMMRLGMGEKEDACVFKGFNGRLVKKRPERIFSGNECITYTHFSTFLALWFGGVMMISPMKFHSLYGSQSGRSGAALAASNAGIPLEIWGQHVG